MMAGYNDRRWEMKTEFRNVREDMAREKQERMKKREAYEGIPFLKWSCPKQTGGGK